MNCVNLNYERACRLMHWPLALPSLNALTTWRNGEGCSLSEKCVRRIAAEFGYAGIAVASVVEAVVKALFIPFIAVGVLIPNLREKSIHLFSESISGIPFSLFVSVIGLISLLLNPFQNRMHDNVPF